jgi:multidrug resistance protein MdtO
MASVISLLLEIGYAAFRRGDDLMDPITERLAYVEELLRSYANARSVDMTTHANLTRLAMFGSSRLRALLARSNRGVQYVQEMGALVALAGRLVDLAANLPHLSGTVSDADREQIAKVANRIAAIRDDLTKGLVRRTRQNSEPAEASPNRALFGEIERTVSLIVDVFSSSELVTTFDQRAQDEGSRSSELANGRLVDREHLKFGLRGCTAASLCYMIYSALSWPEISTSVTTCYLTALTTIGASRQKQVLRIGGAVIGGLLIGMGAQILILPHIDSISGFTVLFIAVTSAAAWVATSSPRLSYLGAQGAFAFFLINLSEFKEQTSLVVARDRVVGILLGLLVMWLLFDELWSAPARFEMKKTLVAVLRSLAQLAREPVSKDVRTAIEYSYSLRESINAQFDKVRSLADGILFEFGPSRGTDLELRGHILQRQPELRTQFVMRIASWKYRSQVPGFDFPDSIRTRQAAYDEQSARVLEAMAARMEGNGTGAKGLLEGAQSLLNRTIGEVQAAEARGLSANRAQSFIALLRSIDGLTASPFAEIAATFRE